MNLPPFYVGQKVVALVSFERYKKVGFNTPTEGTTYNVRGLRVADGKWCVDLVEIRNEERMFAGGLFGEVTWVATNFKGIEPIIGKLELTKVLEKVNEFVFAN